MHGTRRGRCVHGRQVGSQKEGVCLCGNCIARCVIKQKARRSWSPVCQRCACLGKGERKKGTSHFHCLPALPPSQSHPQPTMPQKQQHKNPQGMHECKCQMCVYMVKACKGRRDRREMLEREGREGEVVGRRERVGVGREVGRREEKRERRQEEGKGTQPATPAKGAKQVAGKMFWDGGGKGRRRVRSSAEEVRQRQAGMPKKATGKIVATCHKVGREGGREVGSACNPVPHSHMLPRLAT